MTDQVIPDEAVEAAAKSIFDVRDDPYDMDEWGDLDSIAREIFVCHARSALTAALPILLSHEREETRLAHLDAMVNAETVDRLEAQISDAWDEGWQASTDWAAAVEFGTEEEPSTTNPYRAPGVGA